MPRRPGSFATRVSAWQRRHGRRDLPWQGARDPYRIWVSEIMLQQTQVATVIPYFERFMARFPDVEALARASEEEVMRHWSGLGYYARARNLHRGAQEVVARHGGRFPATAAEVEALPGIGRSTAAAILAFSTGARLAILDGNVKRVLARHFGVEGAVDSASVLRELWTLAESLLPARGIETYTQGLMDLGATVCGRSRPDCAACPVRDTCVALRDGRVAELPGRRPARAARVREVAMLVVVSGGEVLLEKRPGSGIWGGLWSLPEAPPSLDPVAHAAKALGVRAVAAEALPPFRHAFTHFTLAVTPWLLRTGHRAARAREPSGSTWLALGEVRSAALPAPVKRLLASLADRCA
ncbi:MAG: A/G-specific adenine glycosylase [Burkholderiales bacterium]|nr:A/G-specific adenine glycosylase [Burkholderiales bacterium]